MVLMGDEMDNVDGMLKTMNFNSLTLPKLSSSVLNNSLKFHGA